MSSKDLSVHDNSLAGYEVDSSKRQIVLRTEDSKGGRINAVFSGVAAYQFTNDSFGTILFGIDQTESEGLLDQNWNIFEEGFNQAGWPGAWAESKESATLFLKKNKVLAYKVSSSIGMSGWVLATSFKLIAG